MSSEREQLLDILTAYEGAIQETNDTPEDDEAVERLRIAREKLMDILQDAKSGCQRAAAQHKALEFVLRILDLIDAQVGPYRASFDQANQSHTWHCWGCSAEMIQSWPEKLEPEDFKHNDDCEYVATIRAQHTEKP